MGPFFSARNGYTHVPNKMVPEEITTGLRNKLWNLCDMAVSYKDMSDVSFHLWHELYKEPLDTRGEYSGYEGTNWSPTWKSVRNRFFEAPWHGVFDHIELFVYLKKIPQKHLNVIFEQETSAYRCVDNFIVQVTEELEIVEIENAANMVGKYAVSSRHIRDSIALLAHRPDPDFRNSIKESIPAVESVTNIINGSSSDSLGEA